MSIAKNIGLFFVGAIVVGVASSVAKKHDFSIRAKQTETSTNGAISVKDTAATIAIVAVGLIGTGIASYGASSFIKTVLEDKS